MLISGTKFLVSLQVLLTIAIEMYVASKENLYVRIREESKYQTQLVLGKIVNPSYRPYS